MKLPIYIKKAIVKAAKHNIIATKNNNLVRDWLKENAFEDFNIDYLIDSLEHGADQSEQLIKYLESDGVIH